MPKKCCGSAEPAVWVICPLITQGLALPVAHTVWRRPVLWLPDWSFHVRVLNAAMLWLSYLGLNRKQDGETSLVPLRMWHRENAHPYYLTVAKTATTVVNVSANGCVPAVNSLDTEVFSSHVVLRIALLGEVLGEGGAWFLFPNSKSIVFLFCFVFSIRKRGNHCISTIKVFTKKAWTDEKRGLTWEVELVELNLKILAAWVWCPRAEQVNAEKGSVRPEVLQTAPPRKTGKGRVQRKADCGVMTQGSLIQCVAVRGTVMPSLGSQ